MQLRTRILCDASSPHVKLLVYTSWVFSQKWSGKTLFLSRYFWFNELIYFCRGNCLVIPQFEKSTSKKVCPWNVHYSDPVLVLRMVRLGIFGSVFFSSFFASPAWGKITKNKETQPYKTYSLNERPDQTCLLARRCK